MKNYIFLLIVSVALFSISCEKIKDATAIDINTELKADIPVSTQNTVAIKLKSEKIAADVYAFSGNGTFSLTENPDLSEYIDNIRSITVSEGSIIRFVGAVDGNRILTGVLKYGIQTTPGVDPTLTTVFTLPAELSADGGIMEILSNAWASNLITVVEKNKDKAVKLEISGTANYDINSTVKVIIPVVVGATPL